MTEATEIVEATIDVPVKTDVTQQFTLEPTGADQLWILKDASGTVVDTIHVIFRGVRHGGVGQSGKAIVEVTLVNTDLAFAKLPGTIDGMVTYDEENGGLGAIASCKVKSQQPQVLQMVFKANKQDLNGFSFKWVAVDSSGAPVESADPNARFDPR